MNVVIRIAAVTKRVAVFAPGLRAEQEPVYGCVRVS